MKKKVIVSACLLGKNCRYDGKNCLNKKLIQFLKKNKVKAIGVCPEELGGLKNKRGPFEFRGRATSVIKGKNRVLDQKERDFTRNFLKGSYRALTMAKSNNIKFAILKSKSPTCSPDYIYDGTHQGVLKKGLGITAYILKRNKIKLFSEKNYSTKLRIDQ